VRSVSASARRSVERVRIIVLPRLGIHPTISPGRTD
jgi:hypothetical protein